MTQRRKPRSARADPEAAFLPEAELEVLACLHDLGEAEASVIRRTMEPYRPMSHTSVVTLLGRLADKGLVGRRKADVGKAFVYRALRDASRTYRSVAERLVERVFRNRRLALVESLFDGDAPSPEELAELRSLVRGLERQRGTRRKGRAR